MITRRKTIAAFLATALAATFSFAAPAFADITVKHASGETILPATPKKVIVFDIATLDNMHHLGVDSVVGVPRGKKPDYVAQYNDTAKYKEVGSLFEPNYEIVAGLQPDLIIVAGRSKAKYADLAKIAPTIDLSLDNDDYIGSVKNNVTTLGKIFGKETEAKAEIAKLEEMIASAKKVSENKGTSLLILTTGGKISAYGPGSRFGVLYGDFGVQPTSRELKVDTHGNPINSEYILETNPDWIFVIDRDAAIGREGQSAAQILDNALVKKTTAGSKNQIVYLNSQDWYSVGGSISALENTAKQLHQVFDK